MKAKGGHRIMATVEGVRERRVGVLEGSGTFVEGVGGAATVVLAILGLTGVMPLELAAIAAIAFGVALVAEGGTIASRFSRLLARSGGSEVDVADLGGGMSAEFLGGATGALLGLLAVLHIAPMHLVPIAVVIFGGALLLGNGATAQASELALGAASKPEAHAVAREAMLAAASSQVLVAMGAIALGIIAIVGIHPATLTLAALLALGASVVLTGTAIGGTMLAVVRR
jgi:hypothetical protein